MKSKIRRVQSYPQLKKKLSSYYPLRKTKSMSTVKLMPIETHINSSSRLQFSTTNKNICQEKRTPVVKKQQIAFEVKTNSYNRKVEVKTKQEEAICTTKKCLSSKSPSIVTRIVKSEAPFSPHSVTVNQQRRASSMFIHLFIYL